MPHASRPNRNRQHSDRPHVPSLAWLRLARTVAIIVAFVQSNASAQAPPPEIDRVLSASFALEAATPGAAAGALAAALNAVIDDGDIIRAQVWRPHLEAIVGASGDVAAQRQLTFAQGRLAAAGPPSTAALETILSSATRLAGPDQSRPLATLMEAAAMSATLVGDARAPGLLSLHPRAPRMPAAAVPANADELAFAFTSLFATTVTGRADPAWCGAFATSPPWLVAERMPAAASLWHGGRLICAVATADAAMTSTAARATLATRLAARQAMNNDPRITRLVDMTDAVLLSLAAAALSPLAAVDDVAAELILRAVDVLNRDERDAFGDALALIAGQPNDDSRRLAQDRFTLRRQRLAWEGRMLGALAPDRRADWTVERAVKARYVLSDFVRHDEELGDALARAGRAAADTEPRLADLRAALHPNEAFLMHAAFMGRLIGLCVSATAASAAVTPFPPAVARLDVKTVANALTAAHAPSDTLDSQFPVEASRRLYDALITPHERCLKGVDSLIAARPRELEGLPYDVLLAGEPARDDIGLMLASAPWLARAMATTYLPSAGSLIALRAARPGQAPSTAPLLAVGNPPFASAPPAADTSSLAAQLRRLQELPDTEAEVRGVARLFNDADVLLGNEASELAVREMPLSRFDSLLFATHGLIKNDLEGLTEPALALRPADPSEPLTDGLLTASEVAGLALNAGIVTLSACNTASFDLALFGAQIQSLAAGFWIAGAGTVAASLWPVESASSRLLTTTFYQRLAKGEPAAAALREARLALIAARPGRAFQHPRFWAPFILQGDPTAHLARSYVRAPRPLREDHRGGETFAAVADEQSGLVFTSGHGAYDGIAVTSQVTAREPDGTIRWRVSDRDASSGPLAYRHGTLLAGGIDLSSRDQALPGLIRAFDGKGRVIWRRRVGGDADRLAVAALTWRDNATFAAALLGQSLQSAARDDGLSLALFSADGRELKRVELVPRGIAAGQPRAFELGAIRLVGLGADLAVFASRERALKTGPAPRDGFGLSRPCRAQTGTLAVLLDGKTLAEKARRELENFELDEVAAMAGAGSVELAGALRTGCRLQLRGVVAAIGPDLTPRMLWQDDTVFSTRAVAMLRGANGARVVVGRLERTVRVDEREAPAAGLRLWATDAVVPTDLHSRAALFWWPLGGKDARRTDAGGLSLFPSAAVQIRGRAIIVGQMGLSQLWQELDLR